MRKNVWNKCCVRALDSLVRRLRAKISAAGKTSPIKTAHAVGYCFSAPITCVWSQFPCWRMTLQSPINGMFTRCFKKTMSQERCHPEVRRICFLLALQPESTADPSFHSGWQFVFTQLCSYFRASVLLILALHGFMLYLVATVKRNIKTLSNNSHFYK